MREISRYQINVSAALSRQREEEAENTEEEMEKILLERWEASRQEPVRMAAALWLMFHDACPRQIESYLKMRIRNAVETLIEEDDPEQIDVFQKRGWFGKTELEGFIRTASQRGKLQALVYLCELKDQKYGYEEKTYEL